MGENTQNGLVNINLQPLADVTNNLIDKFSNAIGWMATPRGKRKDFEIAIQTYIEEIKADDTLSPIIRAAKITCARKEVKEYINIQEIIDHAQNYYRIEDENNEPLDDSWAMFFYDKAKNVTQDDVRIVWSKMLAGECCNPGSIPKQLLLALSLMDKKDVELFNRLCQFCMIREENKVEVECQVLIDMESQEVEKAGLNSEAMLSLESLGLISIKQEQLGTKLDQDEKYLEYRYHGKNIRIIPYEMEDYKTIHKGDVALTDAGKALAKLLVVEPLNGFIEYLQKYYRRWSYKVEVY